MKRIFILFSALLFLSQTTFSKNHTTYDEPDSSFLFGYTLNDGRGGIAFAWSTDQKVWHAIGSNHIFLHSDFGSWGSQKKMFNPFLWKDDVGVWHCIWTLNEGIDQFAHAASTNLIDWKRQSYPDMMTDGDIIDLEIQKNDAGVLITWMDQKGEFYQSKTKDFKNYSSTSKSTSSARLNLRKEIEIDGKMMRGMIVKVSWNQVEELIKHEEWAQFHNQERGELMKDDPIRFNGLEPVQAEISLLPDQSKKISEMLMGIFFEDINYAADGGLYAELIQNRDFEYNLADRGNRDKSWTAEKSWSTNDQATLSIDTSQPIHDHNKHFAVLDVKEKGGALLNSGWDGIAVEKGKKYDFSLFARSQNVKGSLTVQLVDETGKVVGETVIKKLAEDWKKFEAVIEVKNSSDSTALKIVPGSAGKYDLDMISLFPQHTYKNRKNGLRADLAQAIVDLNPKFVRFPGGCVAHGDGLANMYRWENTIGPLESRVPQRNIWGYHQSAGLGYYEYFQFCEDIKAEPVPVVPAGVPCQNSGTGGHGQQCGIPMGEMDEYVQSVLNLIEWANGDKNTEWGKKRAEAGHPEPFNLTYVGVGNEDLITDVFEERFIMIYDAIKEKYPEIIVIGTVGPFYKGTDYEEGWQLATELKVPLVDEHYYQPPGWFINNQDYYDKYDRNKSKVYLGEYAAHVPGRKSNMETSLSEALYLTAVERNADLVTMTSYAPLLAKENHINWRPDLIYFNNSEVKPTVDYYVQKLFGQNTGTSYIPSKVLLSNNKTPVKRRVGVSVVEDEISGDLIVKLVNLLPVEVNSSIDLSAYQFQNDAELTVLQGDPENNNARPVKQTINISDDFKYQQPAYSFSVIRIQKSK